MTRMEIIDPREITQNLLKHPNRLALPFSTLSSPFLPEELESKPTQGGTCRKDDFPTPVEASLALEWIWKEGFGV